MFHYRNIPARSDEFKQLWDKLGPTLLKYEEFLDIETQNNPLAQSKLSGKASSYSRYLRRLYIIVTEVDKFQHLSIDDLEFVNILKELLHTEEFAIYNNDEGRFPSATINSYIRFFNDNLLHEDDLFEIAHEADNFLLEEKNEEDELSQIEFKPKVVASERFTKITSQPRSANERNKAFKRANWKCEYNSEHTTFLNRYNNKQYLESHHLIPIGHQLNYEFSLDTVANIITLCPNCHRFIHYGRSEEVKDMLQYFYEKREKELKLSGINVTFEELLEIYGTQ